VPVGGEQRGSWARDGSGAIGGSSRGRQRQGEEQAGGESAEHGGQLGGARHRGGRGAGLGGSNGRARGRGANPVPGRQGAVWGAGGGVGGGRGAGWGGPAPGGPAGTGPAGPAPARRSAADGRRVPAAGALRHVQDERATAAGRERGGAAAGGQPAAVTGDLAP